MKEKGKQISTTVNNLLYNDIVDLSIKETRTMSEMASILLANAIKDRKRKRKNAKEV